MLVAPKGRIVCVDDRRVKHALNEGGSYEVVWNYTNYRCGYGMECPLEDAYVVVCNDGVERVYPAKRFRPE